MGPELLMLSMAASAAAQGLSTAQQHRSQAAAEDYNAAVQEQNAALQQRQAAEQESRLRREHRRHNARFRAAVAQSGLADSGSVLDLYRDNLEAQDLEVRDVRHQSALASRSLLADAGLRRHQGRAQRRAATGALIGGALGAGYGALQGHALYGRGGSA